LCVDACLTAFFLFIEPAHTCTYPLSLHDALPICWASGPRRRTATTSLRRSARCWRRIAPGMRAHAGGAELGPRLPPGHHRAGFRSEEHTSELQSRSDLVCRLLLEKKKTNLVHAQF